MPVRAGEVARMVQGKAWRWVFYGISLALAFAELVTGLVAQQTAGWLLPWILLYALWAVFIILFAWSCQRASPQDFILSAFGYLMCIAAAMAFLSMQGAIPKESLYIWIPLSTNGGIFFGLGLKDWIKCLWTNLRSLLLRLVAGFYTMIRHEDQSELPFHTIRIPRRRATLPPNPTPAAAGTQAQPPVANNR